MSVDDLPLLPTSLREREVSRAENLDGQGSAEAFAALSTEDLKDASAGKPEQFHRSEVAATRTIPRGRYSRKSCFPHKHASRTSCILGRSSRSKAGWASKERSTPEGYNREEHAWRFEYPYLPGMDPVSMAFAYEATIKAPVVVRPPKIKKSPEERNAIQETKLMLNEMSSLDDVQTALRKYNRANSTTFELDEITVKCLFFEFGGPCYHYNFKAKLDNNPSAGGNTNIFFAEINCPLQSEDDLLVCCIVGEKDAGHCHACEDYRPTLIHPSSRAYGGGNTTAIDYPDDWSSSDSDY